MIAPARSSLDGRETQVFILGINCFHADSAACLVRDGEIVAAAEEERFRRIKHWAGFPTESIRYCLEEAGISVYDLHHVAINRDPKANLLKKALFSFRNRPSLELISARLKNATRVRSAAEFLAEMFDAEKTSLKATFHNVEHHLAHLASAFYVSPFERAAVVSVDGFGDFASAMWGVGSGTHIDVRGRVHFPHSLGLFYQAVTQLLGFWSYGDEYKVMGLAPYGEPTERAAMRQIVKLSPNGGYELDLDCFRHHAEGVEMLWDGGSPEVGRLFTNAMCELLGPPREKGAEITRHHKNVAASLQAGYEEAFFHLLNRLYEDTGERALCVAGGCGMNSVANGKIFERTPFTELYVQAAAGDAGGAIGVAFAVWNGVLGRPRGYEMKHAYLGPAFENGAIEAEIARHRDALEAAGCTIRRIDDEDELCRLAASRIAEGQVVGWFQGRMEWGPRALGNRSILCDPRRGDMKRILNEKIKRRESFRPFAPAILRQCVGEWFETDYDVPFMLQVYQIREDRRARIPAVTHVNGSGRLQTVTREQNPLYYRVIEAFGEQAGVPIVLNTSFNENEPVVCRPQEAVDCFLRTKMDVLVLGHHVIGRR
jgi:carbamoyltransferase